MAVVATIMNTLTGRPIQKMTFERMPKPWASFTLADGKLVSAERIDLGKPVLGKFVAPFEVWVFPEASAALSAGDFPILFPAKRTGSRRSVQAVCEK